jgi:hypothetical protein
MSTIELFAKVIAVQYCKLVYFSSEQGLELTPRVPTLVGCSLTANIRLGWKLMYYCKQGLGAYSLECLLW